MCIMVRLTNNLKSNMEEEIKKETEETSKEEHSEKCSCGKCSENLKNNKNIILAVILLILIGIGVLLFYYQKNKNVLSQDAVKTKVESYVRDNLIQPGTDFKVAKVEKEGSLYKLTLSVGKQEVVAYATEDGKQFFPQAVSLDEQQNDSKAAKTPAATEAAEKKVVPDVELFVMSQCPYGIQIEKGILPVIQKLGSKINFKLEFVDYLLHGKKEFDENLNEYCIQKEEPAKFVSYLSCYVGGLSDSAKCITQTGISKSKISACVSSTDSSLGLSQKFNSGGQTPPFEVNKDLNDKYGVDGSPALVINGTTISSGRDSASLLKAICSGFDNKPEECNANLSSATPAPGFGNGTASGSTSASCGN